MYISHAFLIALIKKKKCIYNIFKKYMSFLYMNRKQFITNWLIEKFCPGINIVIFSNSV